MKLGRIIKIVESHHMAAILNPRWPPKCENDPLYMKFGIPVAYDDVNHYLKAVC